MPAGPPPTMQHFVVSVFAPMCPPTRLKLWTFRLRAPMTPSYPRGAAVGAGIVAAFQPAARMEDDGARMAHRVGVALGEHLDIMSGAQQAVDHVAVEAILQAQAGDGRAPGAAIEPARPPERVGERHVVEHMAGEYRALRLRLAVAAHGAIGHDAAVAQHRKGRTES